MNHLTINQKREYLMILLSRGWKDAQTFLIESEPPDNWFTDLPLTVKVEILRFLMHIGQSGPAMTSEAGNAIMRCLECYDEVGFEQCLNEESRRLKKESEAHE